MQAEYTTLADYGTDEFVEKRSRFIGYAKPVTTEEEAIAFINEIRAQHREASHNVYAYALREGQVRRYSDDGEPQGTAGIPVLDVLQKSGIVDAVVVVTRYFGGTLLGAGGLVRAYTEGAAIAVRAARPRVMSPCTVLQMDIDYGQYGKITYILPKYHTVTLESDFGAAVACRSSSRTSISRRSGRSSPSSPVPRWCPMSWNIASTRSRNDRVSIRKSEQIPHAFGVLP